MILKLAISLLLVHTLDADTALRQKQIQRFESWQSPENYTQKLSRMAESPFAFFRASAAIYYDDIKSNRLKLPENWQNLGTPMAPWISGDMHLQNVGFSNIGTEVVFGLNDFDESMPANPAWDWMRLMSSIYLMGSEIGIEPEEIREIAKETLKTLRDAYQSIAKNENPAFEKLIDKQIEKLSEKRNPLSAFEKWAETKDGKHRFLQDEPRLKPLSSELQSQIFEICEPVAGQKIIDVAQRLEAGLGSIGRLRYYLLLENQVILEVKEQAEPALSLAGLNKTNLSPANRVCQASRIMAPDETICLGTVQIDTKPFTVRVVSPYKWGFDATDLKSSKHLLQLSLSAAVAMANAHMHSVTDKRVRTKLSQELSEVLESKSVRHEGIDEALSWAEQLTLDHAGLVEWLTKSAK